MKDYKMGIAKIGEDVYLIDGSTNMATKTSFDMEDIENNYLENFTQIDNIGSICCAFDAMDSDVYNDLHNMINIESDNPIDIVDGAIDYIKNLDSNKIYPISINAFDSQIEINDIDNDGIDIRYYNETKIYNHLLRMSSKTFVKLLKNFMNYLRTNELLDDEEDIKYVVYIFLFNLFDNYDIIDENTIENVSQDIIDFYFYNIF